MSAFLPPLLNLLWDLAMTTHETEEGSGADMDLLHSPGLCGAYWTRSSSVWVSEQEDHWEPESSGVQGKAAEAHSGKRAFQGGSMSPRLAFILQTEK